MKSNSITVGKYTIRINCLVSTAFYTLYNIYTWKNLTYTLQLSSHTGHVSNTLSERNLSRRIGI